ncbi:protein kinase [bacterium]|nr:protein kinase [bacterium]
MDIRSFGRYRLVEKLGQGAMGVVYKAYDGELDCTVALKVLLAGRFADGRERDRLRTEARAIARLQHPNVVRVHDLGEAEGHLFYTMDFVDGPTVQELIDEGRIPVLRALGIAADVADALDHAHRQGVVHRDVKPSNVLIDCEGRTRLTDFGLAKRLDSEGGHTEAHVVMGTYAYMPPEQVRGDSAQSGPRADVYSLGATLYHMLTGQPLFQGSSTVVGMKVLQEKPPPARSMNPAISENLDRVLARALAKDPADRWPSAAAFATALRAELSKRSEGGGEANRAPSGRLRAAATVAVLVLIALFVLTSILPRTGGDDAAGSELLSQADRSFRSGDVSTAVGLYQQLLQAQGIGAMARAGAAAGLGRSAAADGDASAALDWYRKAISLDSGNPRAMVGVAVMLAAQGDPDDALRQLEGHRMVPQIDRLARRLEGSIALHDRIAQGNHISDLVDQIVKTHEETIPRVGEERDRWTSVPIALCFHQTESRGAPAFLEGADEMLLFELTEQLLEIDGLHVVERKELDRLLAELKLATSGMADSTKVLEYGRLRSARVQVFTTVVREQATIRVSLRAVDSETTQVCGIVTASSERAAKDGLASELAGKLTELLERTYPVRGRVVSVDGNQVRLNIGTAVGVGARTRFTVLSDGEPTTALAELEVEHIEETTATATVLKRAGQIMERLRVQAKE